MSIGTYHWWFTTEKFKGTFTGDNIQGTETSYNPIRDRERRVINPPQRYGKIDLTTFALTVTEELIYLEPRTNQEAMESKEADRWMLAMQEEIESL